MTSTQSRNSTNLSLVRGALHECCKRGRVGFAALLLVVAVVSVSLGLVSPANAQQLPPILFSTSGMEMINVDGTGRRPVASFAITAAWSPDLRRIAVVRSEGGFSLNRDIWLVDADGVSNLTRVTSETNFSTHTGCERVAWSPDGTRIAASRNVGGNLHLEVVDLRTAPPTVTRLVRADGVVDVRDTSVRGFHAENPDWHPFLEKILFRSFGSGGWTIWSVHADGTNLHQVKHLGSFGFAPQPRWHPDGDRFIYNTNNLDGPINVTRVAPDPGGFLLEVSTTTVGRGGITASWGPDGRFAYWNGSTNTIRVATEDGASDLAVVSPGGQVCSWYAFVRFAPACAADVDCNDGNACTGDSCDPATGTCRAPSPLSCDDGNMCTDDACDPAGGCVSTRVPDGALCDDGDACTRGDICFGAVCQPGDAVVCDDGDACTTDSCDPATGACTNAAVSCDDGNPCTDDVCGGRAGCRHITNVNACDDGDLCTVGDRCGDVDMPDGTVQPACSGVNTNCDDGNVCTTDGCNPETGACVSEPVADGTSCYDANTCNGPDTCIRGACQHGPPLVCDDGKDCTSDSCNPDLVEEQACIFTQLFGGTACDDGDACTAGDTCGPRAICQPGPAVSCEDGDACTTDSCDPATGCVSTPVSCDDGNACTADACDPATGCAHTNNTASCSDRDACTVGDTCAGGACQGGASRNCDDGDVCTTDSCDPARGCTNRFNDADSDGVCDAHDVCPSGALGVTGLLPPLGPLALAPTVPPPPGRAFKQGSTLSLRLQLFCGTTALTDADVAPPMIVSLVRGGDEIPMDTIGDSGAANDNGLFFRYSAPNWVYNLSTQGLPTGTYVITIKTAEGTLYNATFVVR